MTERFFYFIIALALFFPAMIYGQLGDIRKYNTREIFYNNDDVRISGLLFLPTNPKSELGIVFIHGAGENDRNNPWMNTVASYLANNGFTILLPDKRGCGKSGGDWHTSDFKDLAQDAVVGVDFLYKNVSTLKKVGIFGESQGGQIAPIVTALSDKVEFIINSSGAAVTLEEQMLHEVINTCKQAGLTAEQMQKIIELHTSMEKYVKTNNWEVYSKKLEELKNSPLSDFISPFPQEPTDWIWKWGKLNLNYDPLPYWEKADKPILTLYGELDENERVPVWQSIYRLESTLRKTGNGKYLIKVFDDTSSSFYEKNAPAIRKDYFNFLVEWINSSI